MQYNFWMSLVLNGRFNHDGVHNMLEGKDYQSIDIVFSFICALVGRFAGCTKDGKLTRVSILQSEQSLQIYGRSWSNQKLTE